MIDKSLVEYCRLASIRRNNRYILGNQIMLLKNLVEFMIQMGYIKRADIEEMFTSVENVPSDTTLVSVGINWLKKDEMLQSISEAYDLGRDICPNVKTLGDIIQCVNEELDRTNDD